MDNWANLKKSFKKKYFGSENESPAFILCELSFKQLELFDKAVLYNII